MIKKWPPQWLFSCQSFIKYGGKLESILKQAIDIHVISAIQRIVNVTHTQNNNQKIQQLTEFFWGSDSRIQYLTYF